MLRVPENSSDGGDNDVGVEIQLVKKEFVRTAHVEVVRGDGFCREVFSVEGHDEFRSGTHGGSQDVAIFGLIRHSGYQGLVVTDQSVGEAPSHGC